MPIFHNTQASPVLARLRRCYLWCKSSMFFFLSVSERVTRLQTCLSSRSGTNPAEIGPGADEEDEVTCGVSEQLLTVKLTQETFMVDSNTGFKEPKCQLPHLAGMIKTWAEVKYTWEETQLLTNPEPLRFPFLNVEKPSTIHHNALRLSSAALEQQVISCCIRKTEESRQQQSFKRGVTGVDLVQKHLVCWHRGDEKRLHTSAVKLNNWRWSWVIDSNPAVLIFPSW